MEVCDKKYISSILELSQLGNFLKLITDFLPVIVPEISYDNDGIKTFK